MECSFLFESKTQPLYCTYTEINNNHMNMKYLVIFSYIKRLPCTLSTENNSSPSKVIFLFQFRYYFTCRVFSIENFCRFVIHLSGYFSHYHFSLHLKFCISHFLRDFLKAPFSCLCIEIIQDTSRGEFFKNQSK